MKNKQNIGGGGGNRTRVRKSSAFGSTCVVDRLYLTEYRPTDRARSTAIPVSFSESVPDVLHRDLVRYDA